MFLPHALAQPIISNTTSTFFSNASKACKDISDCRTISDLFNTCFAVIFISIWVSMHPDVPDVEYVGESDVGSFLNELIIMTLTITLPELIFLWALKQRLAAGVIERKYRKYGWTKAHAYLSIMGGLTLYDKNGELRGYLRDSDSFRNEEYALAEEIERSLAGRFQSCSENSNVEYPVIVITEAHSMQHELAKETEDATRRGATKTKKGSATSPSSGLPWSIPDDQNNDRKARLWPPFIPLPHISFPESPYRDIEGLQQVPILSTEEPKGESEVRPKPAFLGSYSCLLEYVLSRGLVNLKETDIQGNLSHGDVFAKLSALLSTGWFLVQILARSVQGLAISELETVTLSFTVLNIAAYILWWDKPQRVRYPVQVTWEPTPPKAVKPTPTHRYLLALIPRLWREFRHRITADFDGVVGATHLDARNRRRRKIWMLSIPGWYPFAFFAFQIGHLVRGEDHIHPYGLRSVNMFQSGSPEESLQRSKPPVEIVPVGLAIGAVHFVAWSSKFSTHFLRIAWHTSTMVVLASLILPPLVFILTPRRWRCLVAGIVSYIGVIGYAIARTTLIVLALLIPLKYGLSESSYRDIDWLGFFPIG